MYYNHYHCLCYHYSYCDEQKMRLVEPSVAFRELELEEHQLFLMLLCYNDYHCSCYRYCYCDEQKMRLVEPSVAFRELGLEEHQLRFTCNISLSEEGTITSTAERVYQLIKGSVPFVSQCRKGLFRLSVLFCFVSVSV